MRQGHQFDRRGLLKLAGGAAGAVAAVGLTTHEANADAFNPAGGASGAAPVVGSWLVQVRFLAGPCAGKT